jgi:hypothetical protein
VSGPKISSPLAHSCQNALNVPRSSAVEVESTRENLPETAVPDPICSPSQSLSPVRVEMAAPSGWYVFFFFSRRASLVAPAPVLLLTTSSTCVLTPEPRTASVEGFFMI